MIKYVLFEKPGGDLVPILFPALETHADLTALALCEIGRPVEAGFVQITFDGTLKPYGESISMKLKCTEASERAFKSLNSVIY